MYITTAIVILVELCALKPHPPQVKQPLLTRMQAPTVLSATSDPFPSYSSLRELSVISEL